MCGFFIHYPLNEKNSFNKKKFLKSGNFIFHRGPDDVQRFHSKDINMLFYRLKIIDLSNNGRQPMLSFSKENIIVFNGEIFNFIELKEKLIKKIVFSKLILQILKLYYKVIDCMA